jgi:hypothetical protein
MGLILAANEHLGARAGEGHTPGIHRGSARTADTESAALNYGQFEASWSGAGSRPDETTSSKTQTRFAPERSVVTDPLNCNSRKSVTAVRLHKR